jgi:hypothetical protein
MHMARQKSMLHFEPLDDLLAPEKSFSLARACTGAEHCDNATPMRSTFLRSSSGALDVESPKRA